LPRTDDPVEQVWMTGPQLSQRYGVSTKWLLRKLESDPQFPRPVYFGDTQKKFFSLAEIEAYERDCVLRSRGQAA
jgi:predicted DNA-binding transcriptional regulator AlpA